MCQDLPAKTFKSLTLFHIVLNILNGMTRRVSCFGFQEPTWIHFKAGSAWPAKNRQRYHIYHKDHTKDHTASWNSTYLSCALIVFLLGSCRLMSFDVVCELLSECWVLSCFGKPSGYGGDVAAIGRRHLALADMAARRPCRVGRICWVCRSRRRAPDPRSCVGCIGCVGCVGPMFSGQFMTRRCRSTSWNIPRNKGNQTAGFEM